MNIIEDFLVRRENAFYCSYGDFYIDALYPVKHAVVSHAHGDHASAGHQHIYCTQPTADFIKFRHSKQPDHTFEIKEFSSCFIINGVELYFYPAGHILGSAQILMVYKGVRYLYTGDYKLQDDITCEPIVFLEADVLITETTFADPGVIHPNPIEEIKKLSSPYNVLLGCYALGKAQRLTALLNQHLPEKEILVHHRIYPLHRIYSKYIDFPMKYTLYNRKGMKGSGGNQIYLVPPLTFNSYRGARNVLKAFASGWARLQHQNDISLYLSDHVDWQDILFFVEKVKPKVIWTIHGDGKLLQQHFSGRLEVRDIFTQTFLIEHC